MCFVHVMGHKYLRWMILLLAKRCVAVGTVYRLAAVLCSVSCRRIALLVQTEGELIIIYCI